MLVMFLRRIAVAVAFPHSRRFLSSSSNHDISSVIMELNKVSTPKASESNLCSENLKMGMLKINYVVTFTHLDLFKSWF